MSLLIIPIFFVAAVTYGIAGFGSGLIAMPLLSSLLGIGVAAPLFALVTFVIEFAGFLRYREHLKFEAIRRLMIGAVLAIPFGILLASRLPERWVLLALGIVVTGYGLYRLLRLPLPHLIHPRIGYVFGIAGGLLSGAYNISGPPIVIYGNLSRWQPGQFKGSLQTFFILNGAIVLAAHVVNQAITPLIWQGALIALPTMIVGTWLGWRLEGRINPQVFERIVMVLLVLSGLRLIITNLVGG